MNKKICALLFSCLFFNATIFPMMADEQDLVAAIQEQDLAKIRINTEAINRLKKDEKEEYKIDPITHAIEFLGSIRAGENVWIQIMFRKFEKEGWKHGIWKGTKDLKAEVKKEIEKINYVGNYNKFYYLDAYQVLSDENDLSFIKDKIVLMGFMGLSLNNKTFEDIYFTPLNERYAGKAFPDMYGVVIHANIISMILQENYIYIMPGWLSLVLAVIICYISSFIIFKLRQNYKDWFFTFSKLYILLISLLNLFMGVILLHHFNYKINLTLALAVIVLSGTIVDIYKTYLSKIFPFLEK